LCVGESLYDEREYGQADQVPQGRVQMFHGDEFVVLYSSDPEKCQSDYLLRVSVLCIRLLVICSFKWNCFQLLELVSGLD
jgi:hypothetical protein